MVYICIILNHKRMRSRLIYFFVFFLLISTIIQSQTLPSYLPSNGLVGWWPFNGNANDESGNGYNGIVTGASLSSDRFGISNSSYEFLGQTQAGTDNTIVLVNNVIDVPGFNPGLTNQITISLWSNTYDSNNGSFLQRRVDNSIDFACGSEGSHFGSVGICSSVNTTSNNTWHHHIYSYDGSVIKHYIDGLLDLSVAGTGNIGNNTSMMNFGKYIYHGGLTHYFFFNGKLDDIAIYNRALTPSEITALYNGTTSISGCTNATACNYNASATLDDGSCTFPPQTYLNCDGTCINDTDTDGICNELETPALPAYLPTIGLVGYWPFNGNANDESGNGNHGTVNGATLTADRNGSVNNAYSFDGINDYIQLPFSIQQNPISVSVWFNTNAVQFQSIVDNDIGGLFGNDIILSYNNSGLVDNDKLCLLYHDGAVASDFTYSVNTNYHVIALWSDNETKLFVNGNLIGVFNHSAGTIDGGNFRIGVHSSNVGWFSGNIDDIAIFNRALTQEEITALYTGTSSNNNGGGGTAGTPAASVPAGIPYQAVIRDNSGAALVNTPVSVRFTLHQNTTDGTIEFQETQSLTTNAIGLINTQFGSGTATQGSFASINWSNTTKFIQVEANTGAGYIDMGTQQMMSVPFAIKSNESNKIKNAGLPVYADNAAALAGGLTPGEMYRTANGDLKIVF